MNLNGPAALKGAECGMPQRPPTHLDLIAFRLRSTRLALELSQAELCRLTGIATNTWNQYEKGISRPELDKALILCEKLGITLDWIYRGDPSGLPLRITEKLRPLRPSAIR